MDIYWKKNLSKETKPVVRVEGMFAALYYVGTHSIIVDRRYVKYSQIHIHACIVIYNINNITWDRYENVRFLWVLYYSRNKKTIISLDYIVGVKSTTIQMIVANF